MAEEQERVALVTGGSRGIGAAITRDLLDLGWRVHFCSLSPESVRNAQEEFESRAPGRVRGRAVDMRDQRQVDDWVGAAVGAESRIDCLVNNAGLGHFGPVDELSGDDWRKVIETNLNGPFYATRAAVPALKRQGGWIFNIASLAGKNPFAGGALYNASKFGLVGFSEASMLDLRHHGIRVVAILPGSVATDFHSRRRDGEEEWMLAPEDVSRAVLDAMRYPPRALSSRIELRPTRPPRKS